MYTAMIEYIDEWNKVRFYNARIGGFKCHTSAIKAILRKSPTKSGLVMVGQRPVLAVRNAITITGN